VLSVCLYSPAFNDFSGPERQRGAFHIAGGLITAANYMHVISIVYLEQKGRNENDRPAARRMKVEGNLERIFFC
jgi:hypothetical protein